jgi:hypothetical protein
MTLPRSRNCLNSLAQERMRPVLLSTAAIPSTAHGNRNR